MYWNKQEINIFQLHLEGFAGIPLGPGAEAKLMADAQAIKCLHAAQKECFFWGGGGEITKSFSNSVKFFFVDN